MTGMPQQLFHSHIHHQSHLTHFRLLSNIITIITMASSTAAHDNMKTLCSNPNNYEYYSKDDLEKFDPPLLTKIAEETVITQELVPDIGFRFVAKVKGGMMTIEKLTAPSSEYKMAQLIALKYEGNDWQQHVVRKVRFEVMDMIDCSMYRRVTGSPRYEASDKKSRFVVEATDMKELGWIIESEYGESWTDYFDLAPARHHGHGMSGEKKRMKAFLEGGQQRTGREEGNKSLPAKRKGTVAKKDRQSLLVDAVQMGMGAVAKNLEDEAAAMVAKQKKKIKEYTGGTYCRKTGRFHPINWDAEPDAETTDDDLSPPKVTINKKATLQDQWIEEVKDIVINAYIHRAHQTSCDSHPYAVRIGDTEYCSHNLWGCAETIHAHYGKHWREHVPLATVVGRELNKKIYQRYGPFMATPL